MLENIVTKIVKSETMLKLAKASSILKKFSCKIIQWIFIQFMFITQNKNTLIYRIKDSY